MGETSVFTKRLKEARLAIGISQKQLGIQAGIDEFVASARINQYERGKHAPDFSTVAKIAGVLWVPVSYFYEPDDELATLICLAARLSNKRLQLLIAHAEELAIE